MMQQFNWADYVIMAIIAISTLISLIRGFVREVLSLITWVIAFIVAFMFSGRVADAFASAIHTPSLRLAIGFAILFLVTLILGGLLSFLISTLVVKTGLSGTDRTLGMVFGFVRGVLVIAVVLLLVSLGATDHPDWWKTSYLIPHFQGLVNWLNTFLPEKLASLSHTATQAIAVKVSS